MSHRAASQPLCSSWKPNHTTWLVWTYETNGHAVDSRVSESELRARQKIAEADITASRNWKRA